MKRSNNGFFFQGKVWVSIYSLLLEEKVLPQKRRLSKLAGEVELKKWAINTFAISYGYCELQLLSLFRELCQA